MHRENMRHGYGPHMQFITEEGRQKYIFEFEDARIVAKQAGLRLTVAPRLTISTPDGRVLKAGEELVPTRDLAIIREKDTWTKSIFIKTVPEQVADLIFDGYIIEAFDEPLPRPDQPSPPEAA